VWQYILEEFEKLEKKGFTVNESTKKKYLAGILKLESFLFHFVSSERGKVPR
jgi:hypothetical protein